MHQAPINYISWGGWVGGGVLFLFALVFFKGKKLYAYLKEESKGSVSGYVLRRALKHADPSVSMPGSNQL